MATRALQQVICYMAWDTSANAYKTGDSANHTTSWTKDGTRSATTNATAEVDATNVPGAYKVTITSTESDCIEGVLGGKSSTANVVLIPTMVAFDYLNTSAPATAGIPDVNAKNINNATAPTLTGDAFARLGAPVGASISADIAGVPTTVWATVMTGTTTAIQSMRGFIAAMLGKSSGLPTAPIYRNIADNKNVIVATTDANGNRSVVTLDLT